MDNIKVWLQEKIAKESGLPINEIGLDEEFDAFKLDSLSIVTLAYDLEAASGKEISPTVFSEYNTINKLSEWIQLQEK